VHPRIPRVKFIPKRSPVSKPLTGQKKTAVVRPAIATAIIIGLLFSDFSKGQGQCAVTHGISHFTTIQFMDGVRLKFWPILGRSGNDNIISREKTFDQEFVSKEPVLDAIPEELWPLWVRTGNEWLIKRRMPLFRNHT
jgi:hypothetical protein